MAGHTPDISRRRVLQAGLGATALFLPVPYAWVWAQSDGAMKLLRLPKVALVVGNSKYASVPVLKNPGNDARAMSDLLRQSGFDVASKLDATLDDMAGAVATYVKTLAARKAVGLFYFAGHGVQLSWRNYLVPVDAAVRTLEAIPKSCIDLTSLMEGINKAANPMNVVILDACRENPFSAETRGEGRTLAVKDAPSSTPGTAQKDSVGREARGLSQMDAPHSTLLAYATAPGNVASDGEGVNGLYTEHLLREMRVPEAKIEDIFKRVRLNVRRRTNGQQIPWESTSLEEDFYFISPKELKRLSEAEIAREFERELALWEKIKTSKEPGPLEDYLRRYPSGKFSELAQLRLDQVLAQQGEKRIEVVSNEKNPYSQGSANNDTRYRIGDSYSYREINIVTGAASDRSPIRVTKITEDEVFFGTNGRNVTDLLGNPRLRSGQVWVGSQIVPVDFSVGKRWDTRFLHIASDNYKSTVQLELRVVTRERITVPAGTFNAFKIEGHGTRTGTRQTVNWHLAVWYAPDLVRHHIAWQYDNRRQTGGRTRTTRTELTDFKQS